ncbi:MAG TPA: SigB/SigF/SigG family RNA polymerase sigma factor [Natronosporangium sp.]
MDSLRIDERKKNNEHRFVVHGELDLASAPKLREAVLNALTGPDLDLVVDVSRVRFLDCTAVGMLLAVRRQADQAGCTLRVTGASGLPLEVLETAGVAKRLGVYDQTVSSETGEHLAASDELVVSMLDTMSQLSPGTPEHTQIRTRVVAACSSFATTLARRFAHRGEPFDDLNQVAMVGLLKAVDGYDPSRGREFIAYAKPTILGELRRHFRDRTWSMTVPRRHKEMRLALNAVREELGQQLGRSPSVAELAERLQVSTEEVLEAIEAAHAYQSVSLSTPVGDEDGITLADMVGGNDPDLDAVEDRAALPTLIAQLPEREQRILTMRFYGNMTQSQIAEWTGVSQMHVSRLLKAALGRLREELLQEA